MTRNDRTNAGQGRKPRMDSREQAQQNIYGVAAGQVWVDNDKRVQQWNWGPRYLKVFTVVDLYAECYEVTITGRLTPADDKRYRNGKPRRIRLDRFRPTSTGYRLVSPPPVPESREPESGEATQ